MMKLRLNIQFYKILQFLMRKQDSKPVLIVLSPSPYFFFNLIDLKEIICFATLVYRS